MTAFHRLCSRLSDERILSRIASVGLLVSVAAVEFITAESSGSNAARPAATTASVSPFTAGVPTDSAAASRHFPVVSDSAVPKTLAFLVFDPDRAEPTGIPGFGPLAARARVPASMPAP